MLRLDRAWLFAPSAVQDVPTGWLRAPTFKARAPPLDERMAGERRRPETRLSLEPTLTYARAKALLARYSVGLIPVHRRKARVNALCCE